MCEHADTFCKNTWTGLVQVLHLNVKILAGLVLMVFPMCLI